MRDVPGLLDDVASGNLLTLREWLREKIHRIGRRMTAIATRCQIPIPVSA